MTLKYQNENNETIRLYKHIEARKDSSAVVKESFTTGFMKVFVSVIEKDIINVVKRNSLLQQMLKKEFDWRDK